MKLNLTPEEAKVLEQTIEHSLNELTIEVAHTDNHEFRETLKQRKTTLDAILKQMREETVPA